MKILLHKQFIKQFKKLGDKQKKQFYTRHSLFLEDPFHLLLNNHRLKGDMSNYRSINITGDLRILYEEVDNKTVLFIEINIHSNLY